MGLSCDGKLDGKDYSCTGPTLPPGWTVAMTKAGAQTGPSIALRYRAAERSNTPLASCFTVRCGKAP
jgi:hypothetical protein